MMTNEQILDMAEKINNTVDDDTVISMWKAVANSGPDALSDSLNLHPHVLDRVLKAMKVEKEDPVKRAAEIQRIQEIDNRLKMDEIDFTKELTEEEVFYIVRRMNGQYDSNQILQTIKKIATIHMSNAIKVLDNCKVAVLHAIATT